MPSNIELKARIHDLNKIITLALELTKKPFEILIQEDIFFRTEEGRLKLRKVNEKNELIYYEREDTPDSRKSDFIKIDNVDFDKMNEILTKTNGRPKVVKKKRILILTDTTRIHIDQVEKLGNFIEFEVTEFNSEKEGINIIEDLKQHFGIIKEDLEECAYVDLL